MNPFPRVLRLRQNFPATPPVDIAATIAAELSQLRPQIKPGARLAVGVGSRGITHLAEIVKAVLVQITKTQLGLP